MAAADSADDTEETTADIELGEYESSDPVELSEAAVRMLHQEINGGEERDGERIKLNYNRDGDAILTATQYVGIVSLRDGPTVHIRPKAAGTNLLDLLRYAHDTAATTFETETPYKSGQTFLDALGALFESELRRVVNHGLHTDYQRQQSAEPHLRGQLDVQRQLQRQPPVPTAFECTYDELTHDIVANRAILYATTLLLGLVSDESIVQSLRQQQQLLRRRVTLAPVTAQDIDTIQLTRLSDHYEDILRLARLVVSNAFMAELEAGASASFAMLVNMNTVYENAVERAMASALAPREGWYVVSQDTSHSLVSGGKHSVTLQPDVTVYDRDDQVRLVGDAKWKTDTPSNADFYQMTSYMLAHEAPGLLIYPDCDGANETETTVNDTYHLSICELPTAADCESYASFVTKMEDVLSTYVNQRLASK
jgi:5-methylcytosine-specific restriction enzyme subunit McrC